MIELLFEDGCEVVYQMKLFVGSHELVEDGDVVADRGFGESRLCSFHSAGQFQNVFGLHEWFLPFAADRWPPSPFGEASYAL